MAVMDVMMGHKVEHVLLFFFFFFFFVAYLTYFRQFLGLGTRLGVYNLNLRHIIRTKRA
jgi:hypothetical protein